MIAFGLAGLLIVVALLVGVVYTVGSLGWVVLLQWRDVF